MAGSVNKVILIGNLGADPEIKSFQNGGKIANIRIATSEQWKDRMTGERKERTEWHNVVINGDGLVGVVERYLKKGSKVYIEGSLRTRKWQDRDGNDKYTTEIVIAGMGGMMRTPRVSMRPDVTSRPSPVVRPAPARRHRWGSRRHARGRPGGRHAADEAEHR